MAKNCATDISIINTNAVHQPVPFDGSALVFVKAVQIEVERFKFKTAPVDKTAEPVIAPQTPMKTGN